MNTKQNRAHSKVVTASVSILLMILTLLAAIPLLGAEQPLKPLSPDEVQRLGERMYREGLLPSGQPMQSVIKGDIAVSGTSFTCVSCHMRSGLGSVEGGVFTTPTNGRILFDKRDMPGSGNNKRNTGMNMASKKKGVTPVPAPMARPAYNEETLADVLRGGKDPSGRILDMIMPRYNLQDKDMEILVAYLKTLSVEYSPGVDNYTIDFATVITDDTTADQVEALMAPLESFVKSSNKQQADLESIWVSSAERAPDHNYRRVRHYRWILKGEPETWRSQLEDYYKKEPVFALIGGISPRGWKPVHEFSEANKIPCLFPSTDFPVVSATDWYTLYFSKGLFQEGEAAANYLLSQNNQTVKGKKIVQILRPTPKGKALSDGFSQTLNYPALVTIRKNSGEIITDKALQQILDREKPDVLALWVDGEELNQLAALPSLKKSNVMLLVSSSYLGKNLWTLPEQVRETTYITYPYRMPQDEKRFERFFKSDKPEQLTEEVKVIQRRAHALLRVFSQALRDLKGNFYRDLLFDVISMRSDIEFPLYERMSFGPEQRYASKGCYVVQLSKGDQPSLIKRSEWVIQ